MKGNMLQYLFQGYLKLLKRTMRIQWEENEVGREGQIFGFWHEDSFCMNLILEELALSAGPVNVIVTADRRGDYIQNMVESCGGKAVRVPDGKASYHTLKSIQKDLAKRKSPSRRHWTVLWDPGTNRRNWLSIFQNRCKKNLQDLPWNILPVSAFGGAGMNMRFRCLSRECLYLRTITAL